MHANGFSPGKHLLIDLYEAKFLTDTKYIEKVLVDAAELCAAHVLNINLHSFGENQGVTGVALLAESHISIHTWPENDFAAIDIFMCGNCNPELAIGLFEKSFAAKNIVVSKNMRGQLLDAHNTVVLAHDANHSNQTQLKAGSDHGIN